MDVNAMNIDLMSISGHKVQPHTAYSARRRAANDAERLLTFLT